MPPVRPFCTIADCKIKRSKGRWHGMFTLSRNRHAGVCGVVVEGTSIVFERDLDVLVWFIHIPIGDTACSKAAWRESYAGLVVPPCLKRE